MTRIREANREDRPVLASLHRRSIRALAADEHSPVVLDAWAAFPEPSVYPIDDSDVAVLVAERDGDIAGFAELDVPGGELARLYVHPGHAGQGVGRSLFEALADRAVEAGLESLYVESSRNAADFYERMGFERTGTHTKNLRPDGAEPVETVVDMKRSL